MGRRFRFLLVVVAVVAAGATVWWFASAGRARPASPEPSAAREEHASRIPATPVNGNPPAAVSRAASAVAPPATIPSSTADETSPEADPLRANWEAVDLDEVRKALPDNLYWKLSAPTNDPQLQEWRDAERARWNVEYGKILSGTASEGEIRAYYDQRARVSGDYAEFATYMLDHYGDKLPERDVGLLKLARRMNLARLEEIPRKVQEGMERKQAQDAAREAWLADQAQYGAGDNANPE